MPPYPEDSLLPIDSAVSYGEMDGVGKPCVTAVNANRPTNKITTSR